MDVPAADSSAPVIAFTQGDPAGIGPEILAKLLLAPGAPAPAFRPLVIAERAAFAPLRQTLDGLAWERLRFLSAPPEVAATAVAEGEIPVVDPVGIERSVRPGEPAAADAGGALAALDAGIALARAGAVAALVTGPINKAEIAAYARPGFRGHTDHLAHACGLERYGAEYLMAFLAGTLQVALLSTHVPLREAVDAVSIAAIGAALACLDRNAGGRIAVAGLNPHAGEGGLLGEEDAAIVRPAVAAARASGIDASGPESPDSIFARARRGEFDWVLALYHDQGLVAVKTATFGEATNWTLGLPFLRTSVDHGTAYAIAGRGVADARPLARVVATTLGLLAGELPRRRDRRDG